jgi:hypothetical protein
MICGRLGQEMGSVSIHVYRVQKLFFQDRRVSQLQHFKKAFYIYVYMSHSIRGLIWVSARSDSNSNGIIIIYV